jgi:hypothetical protein
MAAALSSNAYQTDSSNCYYQTTEQIEYTGYR